jgi:hypothetical protein
MHDKLELKFLNINEYFLDKKHKNSLNCLFSSCNNIDKIKFDLIVLAYYKYENIIIRISNNLILKYV